MDKEKFKLKHTPISGCTGVVIPASFNAVMSSQENETYLQEYSAAKQTLRIPLAIYGIKRNNHIRGLYKKYRTFGRQKYNYLF